MMLSGAESITAISQKFYKAKVTKHLKLLTNFVVHVLIERVNLLQRIRVGIDFTKGKFYFVQTSNHPQNVKSPSAFLDAKTFERAKALVGAAYISWMDGNAITDNANLSILRNSTEKNIAADPTGSTCGGRQRWATFNRRQGKREVRNQDDIANRPPFHIVVKDEKVGSSVF